MQEDSEQPVALITGGGRGMGAAIACELQARGYRLALMSPSESCEALAAELGGVAHRGVAEEADDIQAIFDLAMTTYGRIDAVVNHTGHPPKGDLLDITDEQWTLGSNMMVLSLVRMARLVTPVMLRQGQGAFVNITTFAAYEPSLVFPVSCTYRAAAGAFTKLYRPLRRERHQDELHPPRLHRQPRPQAGDCRQGANEAHRACGGDSQDGCLSAVRWRRLYHRAEH